MDVNTPMRATLEQVEEWLYSGDLEAAGKAIQIELQSGQGGAPWKFALAQLACLLGQFTEAERVLIDLLRHTGNHPLGARMLAWLLRARGEFALAETLVDAVSDVLPEQLTLVILKSELAQALGKKDEALQYQQKAAALEPKESALGVDCLTQGDLAGALEFFEKSLSAQPTSSRSPGPYAAALLQAGRLDAACRVLRQAILIRPTFELYFLQLGDLLNRYPLPVDALTQFQAVLRLNPNSAAAAFRLGNTLLEIGNTQEAVNWLDQAVALRPDWVLPQSSLAAAHLQLGHQTKAIEILQKIIEKYPSETVAHSQLVHALHYVSGDPHAVFNEGRRYASRLEASCGAQNLESIKTATKERIRIGYVSADLRNHSVAFFIEPILQMHDREKVEVFVYYNNFGGDEVTKRLQGYGDTWRRVAGMTDEVVAQRIREDEIDVLVDLNNHTSGNRLPVFVMRPAPVQVTMIGLMQTTGLKGMGYRITDEFLDPEDDGEGAWHTEKRIRMKSGPLVFIPPAQAPAVSVLPSRTGKLFTFGCTNELLKVTPECLDVWARIMREVPESRFVYFGRKGNGMREELAKRGVELGRVLDAGRLKMPEYLDRHSEIDLSLDPFPYNGLTVTLMSAWMGVPCVTLEGDTAPRRASAALMKRMGLPEFVANTIDAYVRKAVDFALDEERRMRLTLVREGLRERVKHHLCDATAFTKELEAVFEALVEQARGPKN